MEVWEPRVTQHGVDVRRSKALVDSYAMYDDDATMMWYERVSFDWTRVADEQLAAYRAMAVDSLEAVTGGHLGGRGGELGYTLADIVANRRYWGFWADSAAVRWMEDTGFIHFNRAEWFELWFDRAARVEAWQCLSGAADGSAVHTLEGGGRYFAVDPARFLSVDVVSAVGQSW